VLLLRSGAKKRKKKTKLTKLKHETKVNLHFYKVDDSGKV
jgi:hypothetical protein